MVCVLLHVASGGFARLLVYQQGGSVDKAGGSGVMACCHTDDFEYDWSGNVGMYREWIR